MLPQVSLLFTKYLFRLDRGDASRIVQFVTGHNYLHYQQKKCGKVDSSLCRLCDSDDETAWHILTMCPAIMHSRTKNFLTYEVTALPHIRPLNEFLKLPTISRLLCHADRLEGDQLGHPDQQTGFR